MKILLLQLCLILGFSSGLYAQLNDTPESKDSFNFNYVYYCLENGNINYSKNFCVDPIRIPKDQAEFISVSPNGKNIWKKMNNNLYYYSETSQSWVNTPTSYDISEISAADDGTTWGRNSQNWVFKYEASNWTIPNKDARLVSISVGNSDEVWGTDRYNNVYKYVTNNWNIPNETARLRSIFVGPDGSKWGIGVNYHVYKYVNNNWTMPNSDARLNNIFVLGENKVWGIHGDANKTLYFYSNNNWNKVVLDLTFFPCAISNCIPGIPPKPSEPKNFLKYPPLDPYTNIKIISLIKEENKGQISVFKSCKGSIYHWNGESWRDLKTPFIAKTFYTDPTGNFIWGKCIKDSLYEYKDSNWVHNKSAFFEKIAISKTGEVWGINGYNSVFKKVGNDWNFYENAPFKSDVIYFPTNDSIYVIDFNLNTYKFSNGNFVPIFNGMPLLQLLGGQSLRYVIAQKYLVYVYNSNETNPKLALTDITPSAQNTRGVDLFFADLFSSNILYMIRNGKVYKYDSVINTEQWREHYDPNCQYLFNKETWQWYRECNQAFIPTVPKK